MSFATQRRHIEADKKLHARRGAPTPSCHASASSNHEVLCHPQIDTDDSGDEAGLDAPRGGMEANLDDPNLDDPRDVGLEAFEHQFGDYMLDNIDDRFHKNWRSRQRPRFDLPDDVTRLLRVINRTKASRQETNDLLDSLGDVLEARSSLLIPTRKRSLSTYLRSIEDNESKVIREEIIHVCKNGCVLFRGKHADANVCPICHTSRWVQCRIANEHRQPAAVAYYYPVQDSIRRLYSEEKNEALLTQWHADFSMAGGGNSDVQHGSTFKEVFLPNFGESKYNVAVTMGGDGLKMNSLANANSLEPVFLRVEKRRNRVSRIDSPE